MNWLRHTSIKRKLNLLVGMTCLAVLAPIGVSMVLYLHPLAGVHSPHDRLLCAAAVGFPVLALCVLAALALAARIHRSISQPIKALADTVNSFAERQDYAGQVPPQPREALALLTDAFNLMLQHLHEKTLALAASEERFGLVVSSVKDYAIFSLDTSGNVATWNPGARLALGYEAHEIIGRHLSTFYTREDLKQGRMDALMAAAGAEDRGEEAGWRVRKDGSRFWASVAVIALRNPAGRLLGYVKVMRDVTEHKETREALSYEQDRLQTQLERLQLLHQITRAVSQRQELHSIFQAVTRRLEDHLPVDFACVCVCDEDAGTLTVASVGVRGESLAGPMSLSGDTPIPMSEKGLQHCLHGQLVYEPDTSQAPFAFQQRFAAAGLSSVVCAPLQVESRIFGILIAARRKLQAFSSPDCEFLTQLSEHVALAAHQAGLYSALRRAFDDLRQTQQAAMQQERLSAMGQMASGIAHDINNAIAPVLLYTESLLESEKHLSARSRGYLQTIQRSIEDAAHTVARLREFYRQPESQLSFSALEINVLVRQVIDLTRSRWSGTPPQSGAPIKLAAQLADDLPVFMGVESEIREALVNLILNAVDAMPAGGTLALRTKFDPGGLDPPCVAVEVGDTGVGMDEETRRRCIEPFFTTKGERGTGLGLAMVYGIVKRHGGDIEIKSAPGQGAVFRLLFPAISAATQTAIPARQRILIVDDDPLMIRSLRDTLENDGYKVVSAYSGQEGIDIFGKANGAGDSFAVVFTDLGMPSVDGREVARTVKSVSPSTPVILLTGWGERTLADEGLPPNVDHLLSKPTNLRDLRQTLSRCLSPAASGNTHD